MVVFSILCRVFILLTLVYFLVAPRYQASIQKSTGTRWLIGLIAGAITLSLCDSV